jgi:hypothetical protein
VAVNAAGGIGTHLDAAVASVRIMPSRPPRWWAVANLLQWAGVILAAAGALWLLALAGLGALAMPSPDPPTVGGLPVPTVMLVGGCVMGLALAGLAGLLNRLRASRASRRARAAVTSAVADVARVRIAEPVLAELATLGEFRVGLAAAGGG